jgi:hypothetical protein
VAIPITRADLKTPTLAVIVELGELHQGAHNLAGGLDGGTAAQKASCDAIKVRLRGAHKEFHPAGVKDVANTIA